MKKKKGKPLSEMTLTELWRLFPIILKEYNPSYPGWYEEEKENILRIVGERNTVRINHIGSTAVEGLLAKPTVDILLEITQECNLSEMKKRLEADGFMCMSESYEPKLRLVFNKGYTETGFAERVFHLHVRNQGDWGELYFRDYLIAYGDVAKEYAALKRSLGKKYEHNRDGYTEAKTEFVEKYTKKAKKQYRNRYKKV